MTSHSGLLEVKHCDNKNTTPRIGFEPMKGGSHPIRSQGGRLRPDSAHLGTQ